MYDVSLDIGGNKYFFIFFYCLAERTDHRRRIKTEEKAKVVAVIRGHTDCHTNLLAARII